MTQYKRWPSGIIRSAHKGSRRPCGATLVTSRVEISSWHRALRSSASNRHLSLLQLPQAKISMGRSQLFSFFLSAWAKDSFDSFENKPQQQDKPRQANFAQRAGHASRERLTAAIRFCAANSDKSCDWFLIFLRDFWLNFSRNLCKKLFGCSKKTRSFPVFKIMLRS